MTAPAGAAIELRPHRARIFAYVAAFVIAATLVVVGLLLKAKSTGVFFQTADQVAMGVLGLVLAGLVLLFSRPRLLRGSDRAFGAESVGRQTYPVGRCRRCVIPRR